MKTFVDGLRFIGDHPGFLLHLTALHLELALTALGIALVLALPLGLWLGHLHRGLFLALSVSSVGRALPSLVLIEFATLTPLGIGFWNNTVALTILAVPSIVTNTYFGIAGVDRDVVEAARGMGLSERQILLRVELPLGLPLVIAGIRIAAIFVIATATIAAIAGGSGLGEIIVDQASYGLAGVVGASLCVSALTLVAALLLTFVQRSASPRPEPGA
jgi:osmoprotectant transport system permease protein